jgi:hypothetical protein
LCERDSREDGLQNRRIGRNTQVDSKQTFKDGLLNSEFVAKVELSTFVVASEKVHFRGFSSELRTVFRKTSVGL